MLRLHLIHVSKRGRWCFKWYRRLPTLATVDGSDFKHVWKLCAPRSGTGNIFMLQGHVGDYDEVLITLRLKSLVHDFPEQMIITHVLEVHWAWYTMTAKLCVMILRGVTRQWRLYGGCYVCYANVTAIAVKYKPSHYLKHWWTSSLWCIYIYAIKR